MTEAKAIPGRFLEWVEAAQHGALAGAAATLPMTVTMLAIRRQLPARDHRPIPPVEIVEDLSAAAGIDNGVSREELCWAAMPAHFGFGAAMGTVYGLWARGRPSASVRRGACFGLAVWGAGYLGVLPALALRSRATHESPGRNTMMVISHLVWGGTLGWIHAARSRPEAR